MANTSSKARSAKGAGTLRKKIITKNGKKYTYWEARVTVGYDPGTGKQIQRSITAKTQAEARKKMQALAVAIDGGADVSIKPSDKITVGQWLEVWLQDYLGDVGARTLNAYTLHVRHDIIPALGAIKLPSLTTPMIQRMINGLSDEDREGGALSPKSIHNVYGVLHCALAQAIEVDYITKNPADGCKLPKRIKPEIKPLDDAAVRAFWVATEGHPDECALRLTLLMGLRRGELCGLQWSRVDLKKGTMRINQQLQPVKGSPGKYVLEPPKHDKGRTLVLPANVIAMLKEHRRRQLEQRLAAGPHWTEEDYVFTGDLGGHISPSTLYHRYKRIMSDIGLPDARLHDLRHTFAVLSLAAGDDPKTVQSNLGHHSAAFTLDVYGHSTTDMQLASAARRDQVITALMGGTT